jgi:hypothetical protein
MRFLIAIVFVGLVPFALPASTIEYVNRSEWENAVGSVSTIDFEGLTGGLSSYITERLDLGGVTFAGQSGPVIGSYTGPTPDPELIPVSAALNPFVASWNSGDALMVGLGGVIITLPEGTRAFGVDLMATFLFYAPELKQSPFEVILSDGTVLPNVNSYAPPVRAFIGFISTDPITSVYLNSYSSFPMIDNFSLPSADESGPTPSSPVPEPPTTVALVGGFLVIIAKLWRTRRADAAPYCPLVGKEVIRTASSAEAGRLNPFRITPVSRENGN